MAKSTAKAEALARDLRDDLEFRGFSVSESKNAEGWPKLTINTDEASLLIEGRDAVSKDVFGNDLLSFAPHKVSFASRNDAMDTLKASRIMVELVQRGIDKTIVKTDATSLSTAEAASGDEITLIKEWPTKGV